MNTFLTIDSDSHFSIQNLPYGIYSTSDEPDKRVGVAIGDYILNMGRASDWSIFGDDRLDQTDVFKQPSLNAFMALGRSAWHTAREAVQKALQIDGEFEADIMREMILTPMSEAILHLPVEIGDYTDFYSSRQHAANVGTMFRGPENALTPNWLHMPIAYHGRASSVVLSGTNLHRPSGQLLPPGSDRPTFGPCRLMDFELETGFFVGPPNQLGEPISIDNAADHIFGMVLVNDWSARDIQSWEYRPLGPFLAKSVGTSISPWVVTLDALEPFRIDGPIQEPLPLPYLQTERPWHYDIQLKVGIQSPKMDKPYTICRSNFKHLYWHMAQQLAHHAVNGCNMRTGDLLASGTISGTDPESFGSMLELTWQGSNPLDLPDGTTRKFIEDHDMVVMSGYGQGDGYRVGFGEVRTQILPAKN